MIYESYAKNEEKKSLFKRIFYKKQQEIKTNVMLLKLGYHVLWVKIVL